MALGDSRPAKRQSVAGRPRVRPSERIRMAGRRHSVYVDVAVSIEPVNQYQRAFLAWPVLTATASNHGTITYKEVGDRLGIHHRPVRFVLSVIQDHCLKEKLPPLTIIVVGQG